MEILAEQPRVQPIASGEQAKSFNILASVNRFRYDLHAYGSIKPETNEQVCNEELSYLVEGMDRAARTEFCLRREENELVYFSEGAWRPYMAMLYGGRDVAMKEAAENPRKQFLADASTTDIRHGYAMSALQPGEQHVWYSPYPQDVEERTSPDFMRQAGFSPERKMGFIYRAYCNDDGDVVLESQTIDRSNDEAFAAAMHVAARNPNATMNDLVRAYDVALSEKQGGQFYAGRHGIEMDRNVWQQIVAQYDLVRYFLDGLESIARQPLQGDVLVQQVKAHTYGVWAAFKDRLDAGSGVGLLRPSGTPAVALRNMAVGQEVQMAFARFAAEGRVLTGCGGSIAMLQSLENILAADPSSVFSAVFGADSRQPLADDKLGPFVFTCSRGHSNTRPWKKLIPNCTTCGISVDCGKTKEVKRPTITEVLLAARTRKRSKNGQKT